MVQSPPQGSSIEVSTLNGHQHILIPHGSGGVMRYFIGAFLVFWLGGWFMGFTSAAEEIMSGKGGAFLMFWLGGWTIGGIFAGYFIYRVFRKSVPEQLLLNKPSLSIDTGIPPFKMSFSMTNQKDYWKSMFPKRKRVQIDHTEMKTLVLRETESGNRLTVDKGTERLELATSATEIEREWLFKYLSQNYS
jgi:hypothetical protein